MKQCATCQRGFIDSEDRCALDDARLVEVPGTPPPGVGRVLGSYQLVCLLAEGGMGNIYIGRHLQLNRYVAIKLLRPELATRKDNVARFFQEAHTINRLRHPNIVESLDLVEDDVEAYCVLELLKGQDLKTRLSRGSLELDSTLRIGVQLADALGKVHALGVVHRDLKPENLILIARDGREDFVKLIDFGIAQIARQGDHGIVGTAAYMAPEQGVANALVDGRADIYSLGVLLFEMVTGRHPFPSSTDSEYLVRHADEKPPKPSKLAPRCPAALESLILRCLDKNPERRYATADQVAAALRMIEPRGRSSVRAGWIAAVVLLAGGAAGAGFFVPPYLSARNADARIEPKREPTIEAKLEAKAAPAAEPAVLTDVVPTIVEIAVTSTPDGASVYREGETVALGVTPFTVPLSRSDKPVRMRFEKRGYQQKTIEVPIAASLEIEVTLATPREPVAAKTAVRMRKKPTPKPSTDTKTKAPTLQREGTIDPFAK